ncbi:MAG: PASTA domain-containing protein [Oscillospiraceae bacterium]
MHTGVKLCMGCMNELDSDGVCHYCSYTDDIPHLQSYLAPRTVLNDRYIVGKMLSYNGEGASYICYDTVSKTKAVLREYMPDTLCEREMRSNNIIINKDCLAKYKTYMSEFQDMNRTLTRMRNLGSICTAKDMFSENNTCYVILEYVEGVSLKKFLQSNRGYLQWQQVKKLFVPLFTTLSIIHNAGIIHRGISPENIIVTTDGKLKITGFSISSIRTSNTALSPEFYSGYTAPEQYSSLEWQGTWTDVYSIAAVIYRILTGYVPPDANNRLHNDTMIPASRINPHIPRHVSNVLLRAMAVRGVDRIQTITDLVSELFENVPQPSAHVKGATQTIPVVKPPKNNEAKQASAAKTPEKKKSKTPAAVAVIGFLMLALILIVGIVLLYEVFSPQEDESVAKNSFVVTNDYTEESETLITASAAEPKPQEESEGDSPYGYGSIMPDLIGKRLDTVERELGNSFTIRTKTFYSDETEKGTITEQSIPAGADYDPALKNELELTVCLGPAAVAVPEYEGMMKKRYLDILSEMNIIYNTVEESSTTLPIGYVIRTSIEPGYTINVRDGQVLTVYISSGLVDESSVVDSQGENTDSSYDYPTDSYYDDGSTDEYYQW